ncbi:head GIN domain-containing protein [Sphingosinicella terrae]|uniref:head GIN domain-containing protein n=1 Tax=Sphingosinicella terrae TaxID=2172047 RepID=UPI000E0CC656|nr:head GIN domain-containing protein [Sphingosinicella terrae]
MRSVLFAAALVLGACTSANGEGGDGGPAGGEARAPGARSFEVGAFQSISLEGAHDVVVTVGGTTSVRAEGDAEALDHLEIGVENGTLRVATRRDGWFGRNQGRATVYVTAPSLAGASIGGSGDMRIDRVQAEAFDASVAGSGDIEIGTLQARRAEFSIAGSGNIRAAGTAEETDITIAGSGDADLEGLQVRRASVSIAGSGDASLQASEAVGGSIIGSGNVNVRGTARCSLSKLGSGDLNCGA